ncbi:MAG: AAA family ATPase [Actinomycetota bacterium]
MSESALSEPAGGRTQLLAILFCDQADTADQRTLLGELGAAAHTERVQTMLDEIVRSNDGRVVKNIGGGVMAVFPGASQALDAAVAMQHRVSSAARLGDLDVPTALKIGVSAGDVTVDEHDDCFGTPVVEASRLYSAAEAGGILCSELTKLLSGGRSSAVFERQEQVEAKGFDAPIQAWVIGWRQVEAAAFDVPEALAAGGRYGFVGREEPLAEARRLWEQSLTGTVTGLLVAGEPGVGKSRLARELGLEVVAAGGLVLYGRCDEGMGVPFQPFVRALGLFIDAINQSGRAKGPIRLDDLGRFPGELRRLSPQLAQLVPDLPEALEADSDTEQYRLFDAVLGWLETAAEAVPIMFVVDDFQWATQPTLLLLRHLLRSGSSARLCVVGTYRDTEADGSPALATFLADAGRLPTTETVELAGLDRAGGGARLDDAGVAAELDLAGDALADRLIDQTAGNPFFLAELMAVVQEAGIDGLDRSQSSALGEVVADRVARLDPAAADILALASVAGSAIGLDVATVAAGLPRGEVLDGLEQAIHAGLLIEGTEPPIRYRFQHDLVRSTVYDSMSLGRRTQRHHDLAKAIERVHARDLRPHLDDLAYHYRRSEDPDDVDRTVEVLQMAGEAAVEGLGFAQAVDHFEAAIETFGHYACTLPPETGGRLLLALGGAMRKAGRRRARQVLLDAADEAARYDDGPTVVQAALANSRGFFSSAGRTDTDRVRLLEMALDAVGDGDSSHRARLLANLSIELTFGPDAVERRQQLSDESLSMARRLDDRRTRAHVVNQRIGFFWNAAGLPQRLELCEELRTIAGELGQLQWVFNAASSQFQAAMEAGDLDLADRCVAEMIAAAAELRQPVIESYLLMRQSVRHIVAGDLDDGERLAFECYQLAESAGQPDALTFYAGQLFNLRFHQGRLVEMEEIFAASAADNAQGIPSLQAGLAVLYCEIDKPDEARPLYEELADRADTLLHDLSWLLTVALLAETCFQLGDHRRAQSLHDRLKPFRGQCIDNATNWFGAVSHYLAMLEHVMGAHDEADVSFAEAVDWHRAMPAPVLLARTQLDWGRSLLERLEPDRERAQALLDEATASAQALGLGRIEQRAGQLLDAAGRVP